MVRLLRIMRLITAVPELRLIVVTLIRSLPGLGHVILLLAVRSFNLEVGSASADCASALVQLFPRSFEILEVRR